MEELQPEVDWRRSYSLARQKGLSPDRKSVLVMLLHQLLPTEERVTRLKPNNSPTCSLCSTGLWTHTIAKCEAIKAAAMLIYAQVYASSLTASSLLLVLIIATGINIIWSNRLISAVTSRAAINDNMLNLVNQNIP